MTEDFDYELEHQPGERLKHVDALSRMHMIALNQRTTILYFQDYIKIRHLQCFAEHKMHTLCAKDLFRFQVLNCSDHEHNCLAFLGDP